MRPQDAAAPAPAPGCARAEKLCLAAYASFILLYSFCCIVAVILAVAAALDPRSHGSLEFVLARMEFFARHLSKTSAWVVAMSAAAVVLVLLHVFAQWLAFRRAEFAAQPLPGRRSDARLLAPAFACFLLGAVGPFFVFNENVFGVPIMYFRTPHFMIVWFAFYLGACARVLILAAREWRRIDAEAYPWEKEHGLAKP